MRPPRPRSDLDDLRVYRTSSVSGGRIFLHANESPLPPPASVMDAVGDRVRALELNRYPTREAVEEVTGHLAAHVGVDPSWIWLGAGSNEVLLEACLAYGGPGRRALLFEPTYRMHHRQARIPGTQVIERRRGADFAIDVDDAVATIEAERPDVVFVCTPNNPTGTLTPLDDVFAIAAAAPGLVIVDEAYAEFSGVTITDRLDEYRNVVVARTLSKAFRLAGTRLGYLVGHPDVLEPLERVKMPYAIGTPTLAVAAAVLERRAEVLAAVGDVIAERERISSGLASMPGMTVFPSAANAVLFRHDEATRLMAGLAERGIVVRDFTALPGCEGCLRVTAGLPSEDDAFLGAVRELLA